VWAPGVRDLVALELTMIDVRDDKVLGKVTTEGRSGAVQMFGEKHPEQLLTAAAAELVGSLFVDASP
jgi:hypothetical protein